jgi:hypothetical protein
VDEDREQEEIKKVANEKAERGAGVLNEDLCY